MRENDRHLSMRLPSDLHARIVERAKDEARTPAALLRMLAESYLDAAPGEPLYPPGTRRPQP